MLWVAAACCAAMRSRLCAQVSARISRNSTSDALQVAFVGEEQDDRAEGAGADCQRQRDEAARTAGGQVQLGVALRDDVGVADDQAFAGPDDLG